MKQFFKFFFAALLAIIVCGVIFMGITVGFISSLTQSITTAATTETQNTVKDNSILVMDLSARFNELSEQNSLALFTGGNSTAIGLLDAIKAIDKAKSDNNIKGIYLKANGSANGMATAQQLRQALKDFKASGKFIYAYGDGIAQGDYFIASVADSIFINPMGSVELKGLSSNLMFFKGALDKLNVKPEIFYCGQFKSATEPFRTDKMSDANRKQTAALQADIWNEILAAYSEHTKVDTATLYQWAKEGSIQTASDAVQHKLADAALYTDELEQLFRNKTNKKADEKLNYIDLSDYATPNRNSNAGETQIAILVAEGEIVDGTSNEASAQIASETFIKEIRKVRDNDKIKAVVMRVNSPGGSALASENILRELQILKKKKPLVVAMGDYAASGGYYIACQADSIFAMPNTITGSIGVFGMMFNTQSFFNDKLGVTFDAEKNAPYADFPNLNRPMTDKEKTFIQNSVDSVYYTFKSRIATGRKMDMAYVDSIGQGRVWTGTAALKLGLVDAMGNVDRAIKSAASLAKVDKYNTVMYPQVQDKMERLLKAFGNKGINEKVLAEKLIETELGETYAWYKTLKNMQQSRNKIWMMMPFTYSVR
jgi:protease-4